MPYEGKQSVACYSQASACLKANRAPAWACHDEWKDVWDMTGPTTKIQSGKYTTSCKGELRPGDPTSTYQAKKWLTSQSTQPTQSIPQEQQVTYVPTMYNPSQSQQTVPTAFSP